MKRKKDLNKIDFTLGKIAQNNKLNNGPECPAH